MKLALAYLLVALLSVALLPYFIICFYALPFADDFCFGWTASANIPFLQKFLNQYLQWNGRYTADVLCNLHPLVTGRMIYYQLAIFVSLLAMPVVLWWFVREVLLNTPETFAAVMSSAGGGVNRRLTEVDTTLARASANAPVAVITALLISLLYLNYQPNLTEGVYWFIGIANYHWGLLTLLIHLTLLIKALRANGTIRTVFLSASLLVLIVSIGFNEVGAFLIPLFYALALLLNFKSENKKVWISLFATAAIASGFVFFSPGNFVRGSEFKDNYNLFHSLLYALLQTGRFMATWMLSVPFLLLSLLVLSNAGSLRISFLGKVDYRLIFGFMLFTVFAGSFLPYFATGVLGQHRTINFVFFLFLLQWLFFLIAISQRFVLYQRLLVLQTSKANALIVSVSILAMCFSGNGFGITKDLAAGNFKKYEAAFYTRQQDILLESKAPIAKLQVIPASLKVVDVRSDTTWWVDKCMKKFYVETKIELK